MPTIKTKKEMNLPELIEWGWKNTDKVQGKNFKSNVKDVFGNYSIVQFSVDSYGFKTDQVTRKDTFTVEVEEEITEDTVFKQLIEASEDDLFVIENGSINTERDNLSESFYAYINGEIILIWTKEKGLVD